MSGRILVIFFVAVTLLAGAGMYYLQVYHYYRVVTPADTPATLVLAGAEIPVADYQGIYSVSSPLANRACFTTDAAAVADAQPYDNPTPLLPPRWFDCFSSAQLTDDLASGAARAYLVRKNIAPKIDSVVAVYPDGRAYEWRQTNEEAEEQRTLE